jgi:hypothetical protein
VTILVIHVFIGGEYPRLTSEDPDDYVEPIRRKKSLRA